MEACNLCFSLGKPLQERYPTLSVQGVDRPQLRERPCFHCKICWRENWYSKCDLCEVFELPVVFLLHAYCPSSYPSSENVRSDLWPEHYLLLAMAAEEALVSTRIKIQGASSLALCVFISDPVLWQAAQNGKKLFCLPNSSSQKIAPASSLLPLFLGVSD